jgi:CubicO group peptidase (beta-lactamase class C family)
MFRDAVIATAQGVSLPISQANILSYMTGQPMQHNPSTTYAYSNYGYCLLGRVIVAVTGKSYPEAVKQMVWIPLSLTRPTLGRTLPANRLPDEVKYHSQYNTATVFNSTGATVPSPYGSWNLENMDSHGGWLASVIDMARFAASFDTPATSPILNSASIATMFGLPQNIPAGSYTPGDWYYGCGWLVRDWGGANRNTWHDGSLEGSYTLLVRRGSDRTNWCVLFNQRDDASGLAYTDIDDALHAAANAVTTWPTHNLFPEYLAKSTYLPSIVK